MRILCFLLILLCSPAIADDWRSAASPFDLERLDNRGQTLADAVAQARAGGADTDIAVLDGLLANPIPIEGEALIGDWRCRTVKIGGALPIVVYGWFKCRVDYGPEGLLFEKLSGSQRTSGQLWPVYDGQNLPQRYVYLGAAHYHYEGLRRYGGPGNTLRKDPANRDDPGVLEAIGRNHLRIGFPSPILESDYNFLELRR